MDFYFGLAQVIGVHTLLGLSAYIVLLTGQVSLAQAGFYAIGAYVAGMLTVLGGWHLVPALGASAVCGAAVACAVGFPALRVKGLMLVIATLAYNLLRWTATIGLGSAEVVVAKTLRRRLLTLPGRLTRSARRRRLHLPRDWPWATQFLTALARLQTVPLRA